MLPPIRTYLWRRLRWLFVDGAEAVARFPDDKEMTQEMRDELVHYALDDGNVEEFIDWIKTRPRYKGVVMWKKYLHEEAVSSPMAGPLCVVMPFVIISALVVAMGICLTKEYPSTV